MEKGKSQEKELGKRENTLHKTPGKIGVQKEENMTTPYHRFG